MTGRGSFALRLTLALVAAVVVASLAVGLISVPIVRSSLQESLRRDAVTNTRATLTSLADTTTLPTNPDPDQIATSGVVERAVDRGADGIWIEVDGQDPYLSSLAMLDGPTSVSDELRATIDRGEVGWEFLTWGGQSVLVAAGRRPDDGTAMFLVSSTQSVQDVVDQLQRTTLVVAVAVGLLGLVVAWWLARGVLRPVRRASRAAQRMADGHLDTTLPEGSDEFGRMGASFNAMATSLGATIARLERARDRERRFIADASHDLRTPITGLVSAAGMLDQRLADADVDDDTRVVAAAIDREATNLRRLVDDLLEVSQLADDDADTTAISVDVERLLRAVVATRLPAATVSCDMAEPVPLAATALERVVANLVDNARIHGRARDVTLTAHLVAAPDEHQPVDDPAAGPDAHGPARHAGLRLVVEVADRGPGIPTDRLESVFDRFTTATSSRGSGSGLGLAIARGHARRLGGDVTAHQRAGGGALLRLELPVAQLLHDGDVTATSPSHDGDTAG